MRGPRLAAGLLALAALVVVACGDDDEQTTSTVDPETFVGTARTVDGAEVDLATFARGDLVVWFWAPW